MMMRKMMMGRGKVEAMSAPDKDAVIRYLQKSALKTLDKSAVASLNTLVCRTSESMISGTLARHGLRKAGMTFISLPDGWVIVILR